MCPKAPGLERPPDVARSTNRWYERRSSEVTARTDTCMSEIEIVFSVNESAEGGYEARALGYSIFTQADTLEELRKMVRDAVRCHFEDGAKPSVICLHWVKDEVFSA